MGIINVNSYQVVIKHQEMTYAAALTPSGFHKISNYYFFVFPPNKMTLEMIAHYSW